VNVEYIYTLVLIFMNNDFYPRGKVVIGNEDRDGDGNFADVWGLAEKDFAVVRASLLVNHKHAKIIRGEGKVRGSIPGREILGIACRRAARRQIVRGKVKVIILVEEVLVTPFLGVDVIVRMVIAAVMVAVSATVAEPPETVAVVSIEGHVEDEPD